MKTLHLILSAALCGFTAIPAFAQGTAFTYQGRLNVGPNPATGLYDLRFGLWNSADTANGTQLGLVTNAVTRVTNGLFAVTLDFGNVWTGGDRWLEIAARTNGAVSFNTLEPRQFLAPTPYAIYAGSASAGGLRGTIGGGQIASGAIGPVHLSNSVSLWNRSGNDIHYSNGNVGIGTANPSTQLANTSANIFGTDGFGLGQFSLGWNAGGYGYAAGFFNPGNVAGGNGVTIGIGGIETENRILDLWSGGAPTNSVMVVNGNGRVGIGTTTPSTKLEVVGTVMAERFVGDASGLTGAVPAAALGNAWQVGGNAGTIPATHFLGTTDNQPLELRVNGQRGLRLEYASAPFFGSSVSVLGGSVSNVVGGGIVGATVFGGSAPDYGNSVMAHFGTVGGGYRNQVLANAATVGGGQGNVASGLHSSVSGGFQNQAGGSEASVAGGSENRANGSGASVAGGGQNIAGGSYGTIPGGFRNRTTANNTFAAGTRANANHPGAFVWADSQNVDFVSTAGNQFNVRAGGGVRFETGGAGLTVDGNEVLTSAQTDFALRTGGNAFTGNQSVMDGRVGIGTTDPAAGLHALGSGFFGDHSGGLDATAGAGVRIFRDTTFGAGNIFAYDYGTAGALNLILQQPGGNVGIGTTTPSTKLDVAGDVTCVAVNITSDRNAKEQFKPVNAREVLEKVARLPISEWQYKSQGDARHIGPMAQDFREAFALGRDDKHITSVDADGVALAAIQGLNEKLEQKTREVDALKKNLAALTELVNKLAAQQNGGEK